MRQPGYKRRPSIVDGCTYQGVIRNGNKEEFLCEHFHMSATTAIYCAKKELLLRQREKEERG